MTNDSAAWLAIGGWLVFFALAFGWRSWRHYRATGSTGFVGISGRPGSSEWFGGILFVVALAATAGAPVWALVGASDGGATRAPAAVLCGIGVYALGLVATLWAQFAMGASWRIGVDPGSRTRLVTSGPFRWVRNPIFTAMTLGALGLVLLVPNLLSWLGLLALVVALEVQVRLVEEPYLARVHGEEYHRYRSRAGRFVPAIGLAKSSL